MSAIEESDLAKATSKLHSSVGIDFGFNDAGAAPYAGVKNDELVIDGTTRLTWRSASKIFGTPNASLGWKIDRVHDLWRQNKPAMEVVYQKWALQLAFTSGGEIPGKEYIRAFASIGKNFTDEAIREGRNPQDYAVESILRCMSDMEADVGIVRRFCDLRKEVKEYCAAPGPYEPPRPRGKPRRQHAADIDKLGDTSESPQPDFFYRMIDSKILKMLKTIPPNDLLASAERLAPYAQKLLHNIQHSPMSAEQLLGARSLDGFLDALETFKTFTEVVRDQGGLVHFDGPSKSFVHRIGRPLHRLFT